MEEKIYNQYKHGLGFQLIELGEDKKPLHRRLDKDKKCKKTSCKYDEDKFYAVVPSKKYMIIDVDIKNGKKGLESLAKLEDDLMVELIPTVRTGSGGLHIYTTVDAPIRIQQKEYPDIDFICHKANDRLCTPYAVAGGQTIQLEGNDYVYEMLHDKIFINDDIEDWSDYLEVDVIKVEADEDLMSVDDLYEKKTPEEIKLLLKWLDASEYAEWMANASAIKRELGNTKEAFEIFHEWSKTADNYDDRDACLKKWKEVGEYQGAPRTMATLYINAITNKTNQLISTIRQCEDSVDMEQLLTNKQWIDYPKFTNKLINNEICKTFQSRSNELDLHLNYSDIQKMTKPLYGRELIEVEVIDGDEFETDIFNDFVRVASFTRQNYFQVSNNARHDLEGVSMMLHADLVKVSQKLGLKKTLTVQQAFQKKLIPYAVDHEYNPTTNERIFVDDQGRTMLNLFDSNTVPKATDFTAQGKRLIDKFIQHLKYLTSEKEAETLIDFMAYITQNPGTKILWVPLIQSVEGIGKSVIGNLLINHIFGKPNAGVVDSIIIADSNNSWASSKMLRVLEEIKLSGHNRYEVLNNLKPLITNQTITRKEKFEVSSEVRNTCNFIAFTNYKDALPVDENDRRWWLVFSPLTSLEDLEEIAGQKRQDYFKPLHELSRAESPYGTEFKRYLLDRDLSNFNPNFPPESIHKEELAEIEKGKLQGADEVQDLITVTYKDDLPKVINIKLLREASEVATNDDGRRITPRGINAKELRSILQKMGYKSVTKRDYPGADWKGISPFYYHKHSSTIKEAITIWEQGYDMDFLAHEFEDLDDEL